MQQDQIKQSIEKIEQCADEAMHAVKGASVSEELRRGIEQLHRQASDAKRNPLLNDGEYRELVTSLEQMADETMAACRDAGSGVDGPLRDAVQRLHGELSRQKKDVTAHA